MKKFMVALVVFAITCFSVTAFAAVDVSVGGSYEIRSRDFNDLALTKNAPAVATAGSGTSPASGSARDTQTRIRIDVNAKAGDTVKGKLQLESDFGTGPSDWGTSGNGLSTLGFETYSKSGASVGFREAWVLFQLPGLPVVVKGGHQLLQLGNGWFFRSQHYGSDAWVAFNDTGNNHLGFVNVKISEGASIAASDDADAYVIVDTFKLNDNNKIGIDLSFLNFRQPAGAATEQKLQNLGLNYSGKIGPLALKAQIDMQSGKIKDVAAGVDSKYKGNEIVLEGSIPTDAVTFNMWLARGTGKKSTDVDQKQMVTFLDIDPHYTFLYEYKIITAAGARNTGFSNTQAIGVGAMVKTSKSLEVGGNIWYLKANEKTNLARAIGGVNVTPGTDSDAIGTEVDLILNWKLYDNLTWNWVAGYFKPGDAYKGTYTAAGYPDMEVGKQAATGIQGVLKFSF
jgi:hypothetical protein